MRQSHGISQIAIEVQKSTRFHRHVSSQSGTEQDETEVIVIADSTAKIVSGTSTSMGGAERRLLASMPLHAITYVHGGCSVLLPSGRAARPATQ